MFLYQKRLTTQEKSLAIDTVFIKKIIKPVFLKKQNWFKLTRFSSVILEQKPVFSV